MNPAIEAARVYARETCANTFEHDLFCHLALGYVFSTPDYFIMGRPVNHTAPEHMILDLRCVHDQPDAWLVWLACGKIACFNDIAPFSLPYIGFQKRNKLRFYEADKLLSRLCSTHAK